MPLDINVSNPISTNQWMFKKRRIGKQTKISWLPRQCYLSGKNLWLKKCVVITSMITGPGSPAFDDFWCDPKEFLLSELRD